MFLIYRSGALVEKRSAVHILCQRTAFLSCSPCPPPSGTICTTRCSKPQRAKDPHLRHFPPRRPRPAMTSFVIGPLIPLPSSSTDGAPYNPVAYHSLREYTAGITRRPSPPQSRNTAERAPPKQEQNHRPTNNNRDVKFQIPKFMLSLFRFLRATHTSGWLCTPPPSDWQPAYP